MITLVGTVHVFLTSSLDWDVTKIYPAVPAVVSFLYAVTIDNRYSFGKYLLLQVLIVGNVMEFVKIDDFIDLKRLFIFYLMESPISRFTSPKNNYQTLRRDSWLLNNAGLIFRIFAIILQGPTINSMSLCPYLQPSNAILAIFYYLNTLHVFYKIYPTSKEDFWKICMLSAAMFATAGTTWTCILLALHSAVILATAPKELLLLLMVLRKLLSGLGKFVGLTEGLLTLFIFYSISDFHMYKLIYATLFLYNVSKYNIMFFFYNVNRVYDVGMRCVSPKEAAVDGDCSCYPEQSPETICYTFEPEEQDMETAEIKQDITFQSDVTSGTTVLSTSSSSDGKNGVLNMKMFTEKSDDSGTITRNEISMRR